MRILELLSVFVTVFQDPIWIPPAVLLGLGLLAGAGLAVWLGRSGDDRVVDAESERLDLERRRDTVIEAVRALDLERDKLSPEDYEREKRALLGHGAAAMRALEEPVVDEKRQALIASIEANKEELGEERAAAITALLKGEEVQAGPPTPVEPSGGLRPEYLGALVVVGGLAALLLIFLGLTAYEANIRHDAESAAPTAQRPPGAASPGAPQARPPGPQPGEQEKAWMATLEDDPDDLEALNGLTDFEIRRQGWEQAGSYNNRALQVDAKDPEARVWKALLLYREGNFPRAVEELEGVMADNPDYARAYQFRGMIHLQLRELDQALARFDKALSLTDDPRGQAGIRQLISETRQAKAAMKPELGGTIRLAQGFDASSLPPNAQIFVSVTAPGGPPMPLRAKKVPLGEFPIEFQVAGSDAPMRGGPLPDTVNLTVKVDLDGNPMGDDPGAPKVVVEGVTPGSMDVQVVLGAP